MANVSLKEVKQYIRVDYTDDDALIELLIDVVTDEMQELIPKFDPENPTNRQKLLILSYVKELYDRRDRMSGDTAERMRYVVQSMLLKEMLR